MSERETEPDASMSLHRPHSLELALDLRVACFELDVVELDTKKVKTSSPIVLINTACIPHFSQREVGWTTG